LTGFELNQPGRMNLLHWLRTPAESGVKGAISKGVELAIISAASALGGYVLTFLAAHLTDVTGTFWGSKRFALYELAIWIVAVATAASLITFSIMRSKLSDVEKEARELSQIDPVTGLPNLRALNEELPKAFEQARRDKQPLTLVIFDIDGFKEVNTLIGHDRANLVLKSVAAALPPRSPDKVFRYPENADRRSSRMVFRYGGDEFIVLAFNTTVTGGTDPGTGKRVSNGSAMAKVLQGNVWNIDYSELAIKRGSPKLTVSAGIADTSPSQDPDDTNVKLTSRAELALIEAKRRNKENQAPKDSFKGTIVSYDGHEYLPL
jgi:diguanylate cyclase (GGDEF)-like protein